VHESERLFDGEDRCDEALNPFQAPRRSLLMEADIGGVPFVLINLHLSSKLGDQGRYSNAEDPQPGSTARRLRQAAFRAAELEARYSSDPPIILLMGDFNDQATAPALASFHASTLAFQFLRGHRGRRTPHPVPSTASDWPSITSCSVGRALEPVVDVCQSQCGRAAAGE
jgi:endonuclease/exonuclease/phosphatase family metal-dependent hydrolase